MAAIEFLRTEAWKLKVCHFSLSRGNSIFSQCATNFSERDLFIGWMRPCLIWPCDFRNAR